MSSSQASNDVSMESTGNGASSQDESPSESSSESSGGSSSESSSDQSSGESSMGSTLTSASRLDEVPNHGRVLDKEEIDLFKLFRNEFLDDDEYKNFLRLMYLHEQDHNRTQQEVSDLLRKHPDLAEAFNWVLPDDGA